VIAAVWSDRGWLYDRRTIFHPELDARALAFRRESLLPTACVGAHVLADEDRFGADVPAEPQGLGDGVAAPDHQIGAPLAQRLPQVGERLDEERDSVRSGSVEDLVVQHEDGNHVSAGAGSLRQAWVVVNA
jgi:hypothetical protein